MGSSSPALDSTLSGHRYEDEMGDKPMHARFLISEAEAELIIGGAGSSVAAMEARSGARIMVSGQPLPGPDHRRRVVLVSGLFCQVMDAAELILQKILCQGDQVIDAEATVVLVMPHVCCSALISKGGAVIKSLAKVANAGITISTHNSRYGQHDRLVTITGHLENQLQAIFVILTELLDNVHYSCPSAGAEFSTFLASPVGCEDGGPDEHIDISSRPCTTKDSQEFLSIGVLDEHVGADTQVTGASIRTPAEDEKKLGPYYKHLVDKFIDAIAADVKSKSSYDHADYQIAYEQQTIRYAESALRHCNHETNKTAGYELVKAIASCAIKDPKGLYGHVNFTAKNSSDSKVDFFFAELFWDSGKEIFITTSVVSLEEHDRVGGWHGIEVRDYCDGLNIRVDPQHCYACGADLKHPVDGRLYEIGHRVLSGCYGYDP